VACSKILYNAVECLMAIQGHPRSLLSVPLKSAYATCYLCSVAILLLSCTDSEIWRLKGQKSAKNQKFFLSHSHLTSLLGVNPFEFLDKPYIAWGVMGLSAGKDFVSSYPASFWYNVSLWQTDGRTCRAPCIAPGVASLYIQSIHWIPSKSRLWLYFNIFRNSDLWG